MSIINATGIIVCTKAQLAVMIAADTIEEGKQYMVVDGMDTTPTADSVVPCTSGGTRTALDAKVELTGNQTIQDVKTFEDNLLVGEGNLTDFPLAKMVVGIDTGHTFAGNVGVIGETVSGGGGTYGVGTGGVCKGTIDKLSIGVFGRALPNASSDPVDCRGVQGTASATHAGGTNIGLYGSASGGAVNYSFYGANDANLASGYKYLIGGVDVLALKAPLASPTFTGNVVVPTADASNEAVNKAQMDMAISLAVLKQPAITYIDYYAESGSNSLYLALPASGSITPTINWGDGSATIPTINYNDANGTQTHSYATGGIYRISISGTTNGSCVNNQTDCSKYLNIFAGSNFPIGNDSFEGCLNLVKVEFSSDWNYTSFGSSAFLECIRLMPFTIPSTVTSIGQGAFDTCTKFTSPILPSGITGISANLFEDCININTLTLPNGVTTLGNYSLYGLGITAITIPSGVTGIGLNALGNCAKLRTVDFKTSTLPTFDTNCFYGCRISDIIATSSANADAIATAITAGGGTLLTNYRKLY